MQDDKWGLSVYKHCRIRETSCLTRSGRRANTRAHTWLLKHDRVFFHGYVVAFLVVEWKRTEAPGDNMTSLLQTPLAKPSLLREVLENPSLVCIFTLSNFLSQLWKHFIERKEQNISMRHIHENNMLIGLIYNKHWAPVCSWHDAYNCMYNFSLNPSNNRI